MARYPTAQWRPVTRYKSGGSSAVRMTIVRRFILHTAVSSSGSLYSYMSQPGRATSHFYVDAKGNVEQYIDTRFRSSANLEGNPDSVTVETQDMGNGFPTWTGSNVPKWTPEQVTALAKLGAWVNKTHRVPLKRLPSSRPGTRGIGWHRQGIAGNYPSGLLSGQVPGGQTWSYASGKACPGDRRIRQVPTIVKRAKNIDTPQLNLTALQKVWGRRGGITRTVKERRAVRAWVKALRRDGYTVKGYVWRAGHFGKHVRRATDKFNRAHSLPYGRNGRPTWKGARKLGFQPYRTKKRKG